MAARKSQIEVYESMAMTFRVHHSDMSPNWAMTCDNHIEPCDHSLTFLHWTQELLRPPAAWSNAAWATQAGKALLSKNQTKPIRETKWVQWVYFRLCHRMSRDPSVSARCLCKVQNSRRRSHTCVLWAEHRIRIAIWIHMIYFKHIYSTTIIIIVYSYNYIYIYTHTRTVMDGRMDGQTNSNKIDDIPFPLTRPVWFLVAFCSFHSHMFTKFPLP